MHVLTPSCIHLHTLTYIFSAHNLAQATCQPSVEVVSIYGDDFKTPSSLPNYYIEVLRCVKCAKCGNANIPKDFPVPVTTSIIEIAVRPSTRKGYNVYSVFNHTSCGCGSETFRDKMTSVKEVYKPGMLVNILYLFHKLKVPMKWNLSLSYLKELFKW